SNFPLTAKQKEAVFTLRRLGKIAGEVRARGRDSFPDFRVMAIPVERARPWEASVAARRGERALRDRRARGKAKSPRERSRLRAGEVRRGPGGGGGAGGRRGHRAR